MNCLQKGRETIPSIDAVTHLLLCQISSIAVGKDWWLMLQLKGNFL